MKLFLKIFSIILLFEVVFLMYYNTIHNSLNDSFLSYPLAFLNILISSPLVLIRRDLPFYGPTFSLSIVLTILNITIQTFIIYFIIKALKQKS